MTRQEADRFPIGSQVRIRWRAAHLHGRIGMVTGYKQDAPPSIAWSVRVEHDGKTTEFVNVGSLALHVDRPTLEAALADLEELAR